MNTILRLRVGGALGHLLLVVLLTLGVFAMHTTGHPEESSHSGMATPSEMTAAPHGSLPVNASMPAEPGLATDMAGLCLAVLLAAWVIAALTRAAFTRITVQAAPRLLRTDLTRRPGRLRRAPDLTQLSVLRL